MAEQNYEVWKVRRGTEEKLGSGPVDRGLKPHSKRQANTCNNAPGELEKAAQDTTAPKAEVESAKAQHDASAKLQEKIRQERSAIKDAQASKDAKAFIEKLDLTS
jgi:hypothetical protein